MRVAGVVGDHGGVPEVRPPPTHGGQTAQKVVGSLVEGAERSLDRAHQYLEYAPFVDEPQARYPAVPLEP